MLWLQKPTVDWLKDIVQIMVEEVTWQRVQELWLLQMVCYGRILSMQEKSALQTKSVPIS